jgi:hypothetical protein
MIGVVEADANELADLVDAGADAKVLIKHRKFRRIGGADSAQALGREDEAAEFRHDAAQIAIGAVRMKDGGLFEAGCPDAQQFHGRTPGNVGPL